MKDFRDRDDAAEQIAEKLVFLKGKSPLILGIPRGAVPMAKIIAERLSGELDIVLVHKVGAPMHPEFAVASVTEDGDVYLSDGARQLGLDEDSLNDACMKEISELKNKRQLFTPNREPIDPKNRVCVVVDDGIATGATMVAAVRWLKERQAREIIVATPVASHQAVRRLETEGAKVMALLIPDDFYSVSLFYGDFRQVEDEEVQRALSESLTMNSLSIELASATLFANMTIPRAATGVVIFAHGSGSGRFSPRNQAVAQYLNANGFATILADLLTDDEAADRRNVFDIQLLASRLNGIASWVQSSQLRNLPIGFFGASTGAAAALVAAAENAPLVQAVVSRGGRPDLAASALERVKCPVLLIVGGADYGVIELNEMAFTRVNSVKDLRIVPRATHLFEEPGTLEEVASLAASWFKKHLQPIESNRAPFAVPKQT